VGVLTVAVGARFKPRPDVGDMSGHHFSRPLAHDEFAARARGQRRSTR
jgi:hypothetical protein